MQKIFVILLSIILVNTTYSSESSSSQSHFAAEIALLAKYCDARPTMTEREHRQEYTTRRMIHAWLNKISLQPEPIINPARTPINLVRATLPTHRVLVP